MKAKIKRCKVKEFVDHMNTLKRMYPSSTLTYDSFILHVTSGVFEIIDEHHDRSFRTTFNFIDNTNHYMWINKEHVRILKE